MGDAILKEDRDAGVSSQLSGETFNSEMGSFLPQGSEEVSGDCNILLFLISSLDKFKLLYGCDL
jgi:hypothetical protein